MTRDQLIDAGSQLIADLGYVTEWGALDAFLDAVEPLIRADERAAIMSRVKQDMTVDREKWAVLAQSVALAREEGRHKAEVAATARWCREDERATLRAEVKALRAENTEDAKSGNRLDRDFNLGKVFAYERVLALFDGSPE